MERLYSLVGLVLFLGIAYACSSDRKAIKPRTVIWGLGLQFVLALFVLRTQWGQDLFTWIGALVTRLLGLSFVGSEFVFGKLGAKSGGEGPIGFVFAFQVLPTIVFAAATFAVLYHLGVMQVVVKAFAMVMTRLMGASGAESVNVAASIFMGQTEAPLTVRPFLGGMTQSELLCVMTSGMAHVSAGIMGAYVFLGAEARHLLAAVLMTAPGTILLAKILIPETGSPQTMGTVKVDMPRSDVNVIGAAARGTSEGLYLALNVAAMLISFLALVALVNLVLGHIGNWFHVELSLERILGVVFAPLALAMGVPGKDAFAIGDLLGTRMVLNELIAYTRLGPMQATLDPRSFTIATYALCGFANFGSVGIQIGGIGALIPERRNDLARLGLRALLAGTLANFVSASIAGMLL
ncbi:MAG TPA: nucleoside transporter C-terminal domain-containing protein [Vicinamibacteria bacterium]|jgi:CNT family concentrative nucleoside transporter|nr:nucleoside transporter C-terminal domain-containing protein [Vicinamibacteria bacterium]